MNFTLEQQISMKEIMQYNLTQDFERADKDNDLMRMQVIMEKVLELDREIERMKMGIHPLDCLCSHCQTIVDEVREGCVNA